MKLQRSAPLLLAACWLGIPGTPAHAQDRRSAGDAETRPMRIVLTNDDGVQDLESRLLPLALRLREFADVYVVVPLDDMSGSATYTSFLRVPLESELERTEERTEALGRLEVHVVDGFPADCVMLAVRGILQATPPDLVISGINGGPNLGDAWMYSGTVGAARMAAHLRIPAMSVSGITSADSIDAIGPVADWVARLARSEVIGALEPGEFLNVSLPAIPPSDIRGVRVAPRTPVFYQFLLNPEEESSDAGPQADTGERTRWDVLSGPPATIPRDSDVPLIQEGYIVITPMVASDERGELLAAWRSLAHRIPAWP